MGRARLLPADRGAARRCAELLGVDLATVREAAANVEPYIRADDTEGTRRVAIAFDELALAI